LHEHPDESLLRAIVQVALDPVSFRVGRGHHPPLAGSDLGDLHPRVREEFGVAPRQELTWGESAGVKARDLCAQPVGLGAKRVDQSTNGAAFAGFALLLGAVTFAVAIRPGGRRRSHRLSIAAEQTARQNVHQIRLKGTGSFPLSPEFR